MPRKYTRPKSWTNQMADRDRARRDAEARAFKPVTAISQPFFERMLENG